MLFSSCEVKPEPINYGDDHCHFCDMTVVDKTHASLYTTQKGRSYKFDAIECLIDQLEQDESESKMAFLLVADYTNPGKLLDAKTATFLISKKIKSPMGAFLSAFPSKEKADETQKEFGGKTYSWEELKSTLAKGK